MASLTLNKVEVRYGDTVAVKGIDLEVAEGEFVTLLGPSGCGKTTTLRTIAGLEQCTGGTISIGGQVVAGPNTHTPPERRDINMVFQTYAVWPHMSVFENVAFGLKPKRLAKSEITARVDQALELVGLAQFASRYATDLSGGQQQRVALARAVVTEPRLLLFDEPLSNLDASLREQMRVEIRELHDRVGKTAVYVTHDQSEAMVMSDRVVLMDKGEIVQVGTPQDLYERPRTRFAADFMGMSNLWPARVLEPGGAHEPGVVELTGDDHGPLRVRVAGVSGARRDALGHLAVRPERLNVTPAAAAVPGGDGWHGKVELVEYLGARVELRIRLSDGRLVQASSRPTLRLAPGHEVTVDAEPGDFVWVPGDGAPAVPESGATAEHGAAATQLGEAVAATPR
jgi:ABC-type Fe3+/spermidine/putrescine transport system ATPase subunit